MITVSDKALDKLHEWLARKYFETGIGFRIFVFQDEANRVKYSIKLDKPRQGDEVAEVNGTRLLLDADSAAKLTGYELAYTGEADGGFVLKKSGEKDG